MKQLTIQKNDSGQRADKFLKKACPRLPQSAMYKFIRKKDIKLNGKRLDPAYILNEGDVISLYIKDDFFESGNSQSAAFLSAPSKVNIVYEDENIILVSKPVGLCVHEDESQSSDTLINRILHYLYNRGEYLPDKEQSFTPALCNRIDRNTQGIVVCAKNAESLRILNEKIRQRELHKQYLCVTIGIPPKKHEILKAYHSRDEKTKTVTVWNEKKPFNKTMITEYTVLSENKAENLALLKIDLITGRTHQIRAHMAHIGYPLLGDGKYGINKINRTYNVKTQALCSYRLTFDFTTDAGILQYLDKKSFCVNDIWFKDKYFPDLAL